MTAKDIRWSQRLAHYSKALSQLRKFIEKGELNELEKQGLIQSFEYTFELSWNVLKDYFRSQGETDINGSRDAFRIAFNRGLIVNGDVWMDMIPSRVLTSHTYNEDVAEKVVSDILNRYFAEFVTLEVRLKALREKDAT